MPSSPTQDTYGEFKGAVRFTSSHARAFTLVELMVVMAVLALFVTVLALITDSSQKLWKRTASSIQMFESARAAYDVMTRRLSQATLNPYLDYYDAGWNRRDPANPTFTPVHYGRASDLHFRSGNAASILGSGVTTAGHSLFFFAPLGFTDNQPAYRDLPNLLNPIAYYVEFGDDTVDRPPFLGGTKLPTRYRYRLVEVVQPSQDFKGFEALSDTLPANDHDWITGATGIKSTAHKHYLAENIISMAIRPEVAQNDASAAGLAEPWNLTNRYEYNSRAGRGNPIDRLQFAQMPPLLRVVTVAVDESAAARLTPSSTAPALFDTTKLFEEPGELDIDLTTLQDRLTQNGVQFRVFNSVISLRAAKWSKGN